MVEVSAALPFSAMGVSFRVCPTRGIQRGGASGGKEAPSIPPPNTKPRVSSRAPHPWRRVPGS